jgi:glycosyltransferase involved in cell wall biosynthesis
MARTDDVISIYGPDYDPYSGYGRIACELAYRWMEGGIHVNALGGPRTQIVYEAQSARLQQTLQRPIKPTAGGILLGYPTLWERYGALANTGPRVAVTMFESTQLPGGWVDLLNECAAVIVPSDMQAMIFRQNGVIAPLRVAPLGISETYFSRTRARRGKISTKNPYRFLCWGDRAMRKGWDAAARAFVTAFGDRMDVRLVIKARDGSFGYDIKNANIEVLRGDVDEAALRDLYLSTDCMVFPSRGEGFGLPPREMAATGGQVIATEWWASGIQQWGYPLRYSMTAATWEGHPALAGLGQWAEPDADHLVSLMTHVTLQDQRLMHTMGQRAATHVKKLYSWDNFAESVLEIWREVACQQTQPTL